MSEGDQDSRTTVAEVYHRYAPKSHDTAGINFMFHHVLVTDRFVYGLENHSASKILSINSLFSRADREC